MEASHDHDLLLGLYFLRFDPSPSSGFPLGMHQLLQQRRYPDRVIPQIFYYIYLGLTPVLPLAAPWACINCCSSAATPTGSSHNLLLYFIRFDPSPSSGCPLGIRPLLQQRRYPDRVVPLLYIYILTLSPHPTSHQVGPQSLLRLPLGHPSIAAAAPQPRPGRPTEIPYIQCCVDLLA